MLFVTLEFLTIILGVFFRRIEHALPFVSTLKHASAFTVEGFYGVEIILKYLTIKVNSYP